MRRAAHASPSHVDDGFWRVRPLARGKARRAKSKTEVERWLAKHAGDPQLRELPPLQVDRHAGEEPVAAAVVEVEMRVDHDCDAAHEVCR